MDRCRHMETLGAIQTPKTRGENRTRGTNSNHHHHPLHYNRLFHRASRMRGCNQLVLAPQLEPLATTVQCQLEHFFQHHNPNLSSSPRSCPPSSPWSPRTSPGPTPGLSRSPSIPWCIPGLTPPPLAASGPPAKPPNLLDQG